MSQVPPSNDPVYGSQPYGQGSPYSGPSAPSAPYTQGGPDPYTGQQGAVAPGYGGNYGGSNPYDPSFSYTGAGVAIPAPKGKKGPVILLSVALVMIIGAAAIFIGLLVMVANITGTMTPIKSNGEVTADLKSTSIYALCQPDRKSVV